MRFGAQFSAQACRPVCKDGPDLPKRQQLAHTEQIARPRVLGVAVDAGFSQVISGVFMVRKLQKSDGVDYSLYVGGCCALLVLAFLI